MSNIRLLVTSRLEPDNTITLDAKDSHYLINVMRRRLNDQIMVFNGKDGEWLSTITNISKKQCVIAPTKQLRSQPPPGNITLAFALIKRIRLDYMVQKAVEMGVTNLQPLKSHHTITDHFNYDRMRSNIKEAAEQCGIINIPEIKQLMTLDQWISSATTDLIVFCDERGGTNINHDKLDRINPHQPIALLIGPEGGFSIQERDNLIASANVLAISLGPRILRADTAAVAALTLMQSKLEAW